MGTSLGWELHLPYIVHAMAYGRELSVLRRKKKLEYGPGAHCILIIDRNTISEYCSGKLRCQQFLKHPCRTGK